MVEVSTLGYVVINASNLDDWEKFAAGILGLQVGSRGDDVLRLRMDEREYRMIVERGEEDDVTVLGWELETEADLSAYVDLLRRRGVDVVEGDAALRQSRLVEKLFYCVDPSGFRHEFSYGPTHAPISRPFNSPVLLGGFVTGELGVGHILAVARNAAESVRFYAEKLGLRISDYIRDTEKFPGVAVDATFFHTVTGRHHSLATGEIPIQKRTHHLMVQASAIDDVGLALDRVRKAGIPLAFDLGHHPNDRMTSFYVMTPSGFSMEYGWGGIVIDRDSWTVRNYSQLSDWGHHYALPG
ncbi:VOC family protein [Pseudothauera rhizosphaerae]|uniref:Glyoxalase n=1 Tax=Pseudothauera rhizosphaerae TaxID=2565932 RepID=A0A4S4APL4_9RHOO|nr:VOC family protein [Pseudothauera rhizosphaerae]THF60370.1 glyoxalase [Pseudothauera rhizosphaerae]